MRAESRSLPAEVDANCRTVGDIQFDVTPLGMLRQRDPGAFRYDPDYLQRQSTTAEMSYLRLGYLMAQISYDELRTYDVLELGPGAGVFFDVLKPHVRSMAGHDAVSESDYCTLGWNESTHQPWDLVCGFDVLEHFADIDSLWQLDFRWGFFSLPAPPRGGVIATWRHFKPDEHIWYVTAEQFEQWAALHGYRLEAAGCPEDCIRRRWDDSQNNINSFLIRRIED